MKYKKLLVVIFSCLAIGSFAGCSNDTDTYAQDKGSTVQVASTTQGIAIGNVKGNTDADRLTLSGIQAISDVKGARKDFLDEYFKTNKKVVDYDRWINRIDDITNRINNTISTINNLQPDEKASNEDKEKFKISKEATVKYLDHLNRSLAKEKSDIQSAKNTNKAIEYTLLSSYEVNEWDRMTNNSKDGSTGAYRQLFYIFNSFNDRNTLIPKGNERCAADFIPQYNLLITYAGNRYQHFDTGTGDLTLTIILDNIGKEDFDLDKLKLVLTDNGKEIVGDTNATNYRVTALQNNFEKAIANSHEAASVTTTGMLKPDTQAYMIYVFKGLGRSVNTAEGTGTMHMILYYDNKVIWMEDLEGVMF